MTKNLRKKFDRWNNIIDELKSATPEQAKLLRKELSRLRRNKTFYAWFCIFNDPDFRAADSK